MTIFAHSAVDQKDGGTSSQNNFGNKIPFLQNQIKTNSELPLDW